MTGTPAPFGSVLRGHRQRLGRTQEWVVEQARVSVRTVRNLEAGRVRPRPDTARLLAQALHIDGPARETFLGAASEGPGGPATDQQRPPHQLPPDIPDFTGRTRSIDRLAALLAARPSGVATAPTVVLVGPPGVGKTTLAVHLRHQLRGQFPDGQLYVDLRGTQPVPLDPGEVLGLLLRGLGVAAAAVPADPSERAALYWSRLADRQVLLMLDDASCAAQVGPLLPAAPAGAVLVTSRSRLAGLPGAAVEEVDVLSQSEAVTMLGRLAGAERVAAAPAAALRIVQLCDGLPLAIRVAGTRLAARPRWRLDRLGDLLSHSRSRLDELAAGGLAVRAGLDLSYRALPVADRWALRALALLDLPELPGWVVRAALDEADPVAAEERADRLVDASLLGVIGEDPDGAIRYRFHDLLRAYGREAAFVEEDPAERAAVLDRAVAAALGLADLAVLPGPHPRQRPRSGRPRTAPTQAAARLVGADPAAWFESARPALVALARQAAAAGLHNAVWDLVVRLLPLLELGRWFEEWAELLRAAVAAAGADGAEQVLPLLERGFGDFAIATGDHDAAVGHLRAAARMSAAQRDDEGQGWAYYLLGVAEHGHGRLEAAAEAFSCAEAAFTMAGKPTAAASFGLGAVLRESGDDTGALDRFTAALEAARAEGDDRLRAHVLRWVAELQADQGEPAEADAALSECCRLHRVEGDRLGEAYALQLRGDLRLRAGELGGARTALDAAAAAFAEVGSRQGQALVLRTVARVTLAGGDPESAGRDARRAAACFAALDMPLGEGRSLATAAEAAAAAGRPAAAAVLRRRALAVLAPLGVPEAAVLRLALDRQGAAGGPPSGPRLPGQV